LIKLSRADESQLEQAIKSSQSRSMGLKNRTIRSRIITRRQPVLSSFQAALIGYDFHPSNIFSGSCASWRRKQEHLIGGGARQGRASMKILYLFTRPDKTKAFQSLRMFRGSYVYPHQRPLLLGYDGLLSWEEWGIGGCDNNPSPESSLTIEALCVVLS